MGYPNDALLFYHVHSDANDEHGDINEAILKAHCTTAELQEKALAAARFRWENQETRSDIICRYFVLGEKSAKLQEGNSSNPDSN